MPVDELSGLPLLMVPDDRVLPILWEFESNRRPDGGYYCDWDHAWFPAREVNGAGEDGVALRNARVQYILRAEQHEPKNAHFPTLKLPATPAERFRAVVLCAAGYIPPEAIAFSSDGYRTKLLNDWQTMRLRESGEVKMASPSTVRRYMTDFVLSQSFDHVKPRTINRFLRLDPRQSSDAAKEHQELSYRLLSLAIDRVEDDPLIRPYTMAHQNELLALDAPPRPDWFIRSCIIGGRKNLSNIGRQLMSRLVHYRDGPRAAAHLGNLAITRP